MRKVVIDYEFQVFDRKTQEEIYCNTGSYSWTSCKFIGIRNPVVKVVDTINKCYPYCFTRLRITKITIDEISWCDTPLIHIWLLPLFLMISYILQKIIFS